MTIRILPFKTTLTQKIDATQSYIITRQYDGLGRQTKQVSGGAIVDTNYVNPTQTQQSTPYFTGETPSYTTTTVEPTAHTTTVIAPDGTSSVTTTDGLLATLTDANQHTTTTLSDMWGRTQSVIPPTGPSLTYTYDELNRLKEVKRTGAANDTGPGTNGLISWWSMNETGGARNDSHTTANNLTNYNTVGYAAGLKGNAALITPASLQRLTRNDNASLSTGDIDFTLVANVYLNSTTNTMVIANKGDKADQNKRDYTLYYAGGAFGMRVGNGTTSSAVTSTGTLSAGQWYTIIAWHDSVNNTLNIQVNNGTVNTVSYSGGAMDTTFPLSIGAHFDGTYGLNGRIDEVAFYKRVLTPSERTWLYNGGSGRSYAELTPQSGSTTTTTMTYDNAGRKKSMVDPDMGTWTYTYDALNNLKTQTDARSCMLTMGYDLLNRLTSKNSSGAGCGTQESSSYTYDLGANGKGLRTSMTDASGSSAWTYDTRGRMRSESKVLTGAGSSILPGRITPRIYLLR